MGRIRLGLGLGGLGQAAFKPSDLSGLAFWVRADLGVTVDGSNNVSTWADQSGNGNDLTQATTANRPSYQTIGGANGKPYLQYTAHGDQSLDNSAIIQLQPFEGFLVLHQNAASSGTVYILDIGLSGSSGAINQPSASTTIRFAAGDSQNTTTVGDHLVDAQWNGTSSGIGIDGAALVTSNHTQNLVGLHAGQAGGLTGFGMNGNLYEILIYSRILSSSERSKIKSYITNRYWITLS